MDYSGCLFCCAARDCESRKNRNFKIFIKLCQKTHKLACGMNDILLEQGFLGDGESPNNRLLTNPMGGIKPPGGFGNGSAIKFTCEV